MSLNLILKFKLCLEKIKLYFLPVKLSSCLRQALAIVWSEPLHLGCLGALHTGHGSSFYLITNVRKEKVDTIGSKVVKFF